MTAEHVRRLHFTDHATVETGRRVCRRVLKRLADLGLTRQLDRRIGGLRAGSAGLIHGLTPIGHRVLELEHSGGQPGLGRKRWSEPSAGFVDHTLAIAELGSLAVATSVAAGHDVLSIEPEPDAWRTFHDGSIEQILKPDLALVVADALTERSWFIEVDLSTESRTVVASKCQLYTTYWRTGIEQAEHGVFPRVLWVAPDQRRADVIASVFDRRGVEPRLFEATTETQAAALLLGAQQVSNRKEIL